MRNFISILSIFFAFSSFTVFAHEGETHAPKAPVSSEMASTSAQHVITEGIKRNQLPASWENSQLVSVEKNKGADKSEWVVKFNNESIEDSAEKTLYIFLNLDGSYITANFIGPASSYSK